MNKKNVAPEHIWSIDSVVNGLRTQIFCIAGVKLKYLSQHQYMNKKNVAPEHIWSIDYVVNGLRTQFLV